jgi:hypothetical protein
MVEAIFINGTVGAGKSVRRRSARRSGCSAALRRRYRPRRYLMVRLEAKPGVVEARLRRRHASLDGLVIDTTELSIRATAGLIRVRAGW